MKKSISILIIAILGVVIVGWQVGARCYMLRKVYRHPQARHRVAIVPTQLDLATLQVPQGVTCNVGYAEFVIPSAPSVDLKSSGGIAVIGESDTLTFAFLPPWDPSAPDSTAESFKSELSKLPESNPLRAELADPDATHLDLLINMERMTPEPFLTVLFQDQHLFAFRTMQLILKGAMQDGSRSVHTYATPHTRGLILVGKDETDVSYAQVSIENQSGTQAVGMLAHLPDGKPGDITQILPPLLKTFRFTAEHLNSEDEISELIARAGVPPRPEDQKTGESNTSLNPISGSSIKLPEKD